MPAAYRFLASGLPDDGFGSGGAVATRFSDASAGVARQVIMPDDRSIVVAGLSDNAGDAGVSGVGLLKLAVDGTPDSSFGNLPGLPGRTFISDDSLLDVRIVSLAGGLPVTFLRRNNNNDTIHLAKVLADGRIDSSYGTNGVRSTGVPSQNIVTFIFNDSLLRVIGTYNPPGSPKRIQLLRFSANLEPDPGFGLNGYRLLPAIGGADMDNVLHSARQLPNGKLLLLGHASPAAFNNPTPFILRLLSDGEPDTSFNGIGHMLVSTEFAADWNNIDSTDSTNFVISRTPDFMLSKFVPDDTVFLNVSAAQFDYVVEKGTVFFTNKTKGALFNQWEFGDGETSQQVNPTHTFSPGVYPVTLGVYTGCELTAVTKTVAVRGLHKISPRVAPASGFTAFRLYGYRLDEAEGVLLANGAISIPADTIFFDSATQTPQANFRFRNAPAFTYDVVVRGLRCPDRLAPCGDTLPFMVDIRGQRMGQPWVQVAGPSSVRPDPAGRRAFFRLDYGFGGNVSQYLVPLALVVEGKGKNVYPAFSRPLANAVNAGFLPDSLLPRSNGFYRFYDAIRQDSAWVAFLADVVLPPGETESLEFTMTQETGDSINVRAYIGQSLFDPAQKATLNNLRTQGEGCNSCMKCLLDAAGYLPGPFGCAAGVVSLACSVSEFEITPKPRWVKC